MSYTAGRTNTSSNTNFQQNQGSNNQYGSKITMTESGLIQYLDVYFAADPSAGSCNARLCLWSSSGVLLATTPVFTLAATGSLNLNAQAWQRQALSTPYFATAADYYVGFWRASSGKVNFSYLNSGGTIHPGTGSGTANVGSPGNLSTGTSTTGQLSAYVEYVKGGLGFYDGSSFKKYGLKRFNGSAFQRHPLKRYSGSTWEWFA